MIVKGFMLHPLFAILFNLLLTPNLFFQVLYLFILFGYKKI